MPIHPTILWFQKNKELYLTVKVEKVDEFAEGFEVHLTENKFTFKCFDNQNQEYEAEIEFYGKVDGENFTRSVSHRGVSLVIYKKEEDFWPQLQKNDSLNFLKFDSKSSLYENEDDNVDFQGSWDQAAVAGAPPNMDNLPEVEDNDDEEDEEEN